jgi:membrane protein involved in D-alanine export
VVSFLNGDSFRDVIVSNGTISFSQLGFCALSSVLVYLFPFLRQVWILAVLSIVVGALSPDFCGYLLVNVSVFLFALSLEKMSKISKFIRKARWSISCSLIVVLLVLFLLIRETSSTYHWTALLSGLNMWTFLILATFLWETGSGSIPSLHFGRYLLWANLPFTMAGPILRHSQYLEQQKEIHNTRWIYRKPSRDWVVQLSYGLGQILVGLTLFYIQNRLESETHDWTSKLIISFSIAPWKFYLLMAGYFKMMECLAVFWGIKLPISFDNPFFRKNISDFWSNWNITATSVFRDYLFYNRWGFRSANLYVNTLIVFFLVGLWHGSNVYWLMWGSLHGVGFCLFLFYKKNFSEVTSLNGNAKNVLQLSTRIMTYIFVCSCWFVPPKIIQLVHRAF